MENATKALLMAGSVLLGIIVLSLFVIMANSLTDYQKSQTQNEREAQIVAFNNQYEGYIRDDVSGSDILSLINKVTFYNRTKSSAGDEGEDFGYQPIRLVIDFDNKQNLFSKSKNKLFTARMMEFDGQDKTSVTSAIDRINEIVDQPSNSGPTLKDEKGRVFYYTDGVLQSLSENYANGKLFKDELFERENPSEDQIKEMIKVFADFNACVGKYYFPYNDLNKDNRVTKLKEWYNKYLKGNDEDALINKLDCYYEYTQFKRAKFKWNPDKSESVYDSNTNRIVYMKFTFTGNFI